MKFIIEYGVKGGTHIDNLVLDMTLDMASKMFSSLALAFQKKNVNDEFSFKTLKKFFSYRDQVTWNDETHYICFTRYSWAKEHLPGPASAKYWHTKGEFV